MNNTVHEESHSAHNTSETVSNYFERRNDAELRMAEMSQLERSFEPFQEGFERRVIESLEKEQISEFKKAFATFDKDGDGTMQTKELRAAMRSVGQNPTDMELQEMINEIDINGNGTIDFIEFLYMMVRMLNQDNDEKDASTAFRVFDENSCGYIDAEEFQDVLHTADETLTEEEAKEIMGQIGPLRGNKMSYQQFFKLMSW